MTFVICSGCRSSSNQGVGYRQLLWLLSVRCVHSILAQTSQHFVAFQRTHQHSMKIHAKQARSGAQMMMNADELMTSLLVPNEIAWFLRPLIRDQLGKSIANVSCFNKVTFQ